MPYNLVTLPGSASDHHPVTVIVFGNVTPAIAQTAFQFLFCIFLEYASTIGPLHTSY